MAAGRICRALALPSVSALLAKVPDLPADRAFPREEAQKRQNLVLQKSAARYAAQIPVAAVDAGSVRKIKMRSTAVLHGRSFSYHARRKHVSNAQPGCYQRCRNCAGPYYRHLFDKR